MAHKSTFLAKFRRRRENKTDYVKRIALLKSGQARLVVRRSINNIIAQFVIAGEKGDNVVASAHSKELEKFGWKAHAGNLPSAYLTGLLAGLRAKDKKVAKAVLDIGIASSKHGTGIFAALKGAVDAGIQIPHDETALPKKDRIEGKHIEEFAKKLDGEALQKQFGACIKAGFDPKKAVLLFEKAKAELLKNYSVEKKQAKEKK